MNIKVEVALVAIIVSCLWFCVGYRYCVRVSMKKPVVIMYYSNDSDTVFTVAHYWPGDTLKINKCTNP